MAVSYFCLTHFLSFGRVIVVYFCAIVIGALGVFSSIASVFEVGDNYSLQTWEDDKSQCDGSTTDGDDRYDQKVGFEEMIFPSFLFFFCFHDHKS